MGALKCAAHAMPSMPAVRLIAHPKHLDLRTAMRTRCSVYQIATAGQHVANTLVAEEAGAQLVRARVSRATTLQHTRSPSEDGQPASRTSDMTLHVVQTTRFAPFANPRDRVATLELGLSAATQGMFSARRVKAGRSWSLGQIVGDEHPWFTFVYVLASFMTLRLADRTVTVLKHNAISQVIISTGSVVDVSPQLEFIEVQVSDDARIRALMPNLALPSIALDEPELHVKGQGLRDFFDYRDLGVARVTNRQWKSRWSGPTARGRVGQGGARTPWRN
jgi:hypothetical protein